MNVYSLFVFRQGRCTLFPNTPLYPLPFLLLLIRFFLILVFYIKNNWLQQRYYEDGQVANVHLAGAANNYLRNQHQRQYVHELQVFRQRQLLERNPQQVKRCPRCKNNVVKENNNNHMACWNCTTQFCYLCAEVIFGTAHFNKGKCKHHTADWCNEYGDIKKIKKNLVLFYFLCSCCYYY